MAAVGGQSFEGIKLSRKAFELLASGKGRVIEGSKLRVLTTQALVSGLEVQHIQAEDYEREVKRRMVHALAAELANHVTVTEENDNDPCDPHARRYRVRLEMLTE